MRKISKFSILVTLHFISEAAAFVTVSDVRGMIYLTKYGYAESQSWTKSLENEDSYKSLVNQSVIGFQEFARIDPTGILDESTMEMMKTPRCGVKDAVGKGAGARRKKRWADCQRPWFLENSILTLTQKEAEEVCYA